MLLFSLETVLDRAVKVTSLKWHDIAMIAREINRTMNGYDFKWTLKQINKLLRRERDTSEVPSPTPPFSLPYSLRISSELNSV